MEANTPLPLRLNLNSNVWRLWRQALVGVVVLLLVALIVQIEMGWGGGDIDAFFMHFVYNAIPLLAGLCCAFNRSSSQVERRAWLLLGAGFAGWGLGNVYYTVAFATAAADEIPFPSFADAGYLAFYPPVFVGLALLARAQLVRFSRASWLDGLIAGLTIGAIGAAVIFHPVLESTGGNFAAVATNLAYPLGDVMLLALIVGALCLSGWRLSRAWIAISLGLGCFALSDSLYLVRIANGTYEYGSFVDFGWVTASAFVAVGSVLRPGGALRSADVRMLPLAPTVFAVLNVGIMTYDHFTRVDLLALVLSAAALFAVVARMTLSLLENGAMLRASRHEAETDALTGLRNRRKLHLDLERALAPGSTETWVILMFDLDGFKGYNDTFGHPAGDALLVRLAGRLAKVVEPHGSAYRLGGDEFCVLAAGGFGDVGPFRTRAAVALSEKGEGFAIRSSCGVAVLPQEAATASEALRLIDVRMYEEKSSRPSAGKQTMNVLLSALQERDPDLATHTGAVARLAGDVAQVLGLNSETLERVALAGQLHDIGKIAIPESILAKPEPLNPSEWAFIKRHTIIGERIVGAAPALATVGGLIRSSHERWDGDGYPDRLRAEEIPLGARIVFVCDSYHSMTSDRPYQSAMNPAEARDELLRNAGTQFDPAVVDALLQVLDAEQVLAAA